MAVAPFASAHCEGLAAKLEVLGPGTGDDPFVATVRLDSLGPDSCVIKSWALAWGDGGTAAGEGDPEGLELSHTYHLPEGYQGSAYLYEARLVVTEHEGKTDDDVAQLTVRRANQLPLALLLATPGSGSAPLQVTFSLDADDPDGSLASWALRFRDGHEVGGDGSPAGLQRLHTYPEGSWTATLRVTDDRGGTAESSVNVNVAAGGGANRPPTARLTAVPAQGEAPLAAELRVEASDPDGPADLASWTLAFGDGGTAQGTGDPDGTRLRHRYAAGSWQAVLTVRDARGASAVATADVRATVGGNLPPTARLEAEPEGGPAPLQVRFRVHATDADGTLARWSLDFGDGTPAERGTGPVEANVTHTYLGAGVHTATLRAEDATGAFRTSQVEVRVTSAPGARSPGLRLSVLPAEGSAPLQATAHLATKPGFDRIVAWAVDFGDGARAAGLGDPHGLALHHAYPHAGAFEVLARLTLASGLVLEEQAAVTVAAAPAPAAAAPPTLALEATPAVGHAPAEVRFRARASVPLEGTWTLDFGDGGALTFEGQASGLDVVHRYGRGLSGPARLTVTTPTGTFTAETHVRLLDAAPLRTASGEAQVLPLLGALPVLVLVALGLVALAGPRGRVLTVVAVLLGVGLALPAEAFLVRHRDSAGVYTSCVPKGGPGTCDEITVTWSMAGPRPSNGIGRVVAPDGSVLPAQGTPSLRFEPPDGVPAPGTWTLAYQPLCNDPAVADVAYDVRWTLAGRAGNATGRGCGPLLWVWNWAAAPPIAHSDAPLGTLLFLNPSARGGVYAQQHEALEPAFYADAPLYYNLDGVSLRPDLDTDLDGIPSWREVLQHNSNPFDDRSRADTDDDGDGRRNVFDDEPWWFAAVEGALRAALKTDAEQVPPLHAPPRPDRLRALLLANATAFASTPLADDVALVTERAGSEGPEAVWEATTERVELRITNLRPPSPGIDRSLLEVQLRPVEHDPTLFIDVGATSLSTPPGVRLQADERPDGVHALRWSGLHLGPGQQVVLPLVVVAPRTAGDRAFEWEVVTYDGAPGDDARVTRALLRLLDDSAPPTTELAPPVALVRRDTVLRLAATDAGSGPDLTLAGLDGEVPVPTRAVLLAAPSDGSADGPHRLTFRSQDRSGNVEAWRNATVVVDTQPPWTDLAGPTRPQPGPFEVRLQAHDALSGVGAVRYRLWREGAPRPSAAVEGTAVRIADDGRWLLEYAAEDVAGNAEAPRLALLHLDGPDKLHLEAAPAATMVRPGEPVTLTVRARNLAGEPAAEARLVPALPPGHTLLAASPPLRPDGSWSLGTLGAGEGWEGSVTLRPPAAPVASVATLALRLEARFTTGLRNATLQVPLTTGPLHRIDLACPEEVALDATGTARAVCLLRNQGNVPSSVRVDAAPPWDLRLHLPDEEGWPDASDPVVEAVTVPPGEVRTLALLVRGSPGRVEVTASEGTAEATASLALLSAPLRGLLVEPAQRGVNVRNVGTNPETVQDVGLLAPGASALLAGGRTVERSVVWTGPALAAAALPEVVVAATPPAAPVARPALTGRVVAEGEEAVVTLELRGADEAALGGAVAVEGVHAELDGRGAATMRVPTRRLADGFVVRAPAHGLEWRFPPTGATAQATWAVTLDPHGVHGLLRGLPPGTVATVDATWTLRRGALAAGTVEGHASAEGLAFALGFPEGAQALRLDAPAFVGALDLAGGGAVGALVAVEAPSFRTPTRPASLGLQADGAAWTLALRNDAPWAATEVRWELLDGAGALLASGSLPAQVPAHGEATVALALPVEALRRAAAARFTLASAEGLEVVLPAQQVPSADTSVVTAASPVPAPEALALLAFAGAALLLRRRRPP